MNTERISAPFRERPGYDALWLWFGLSHANWLTVPRVILHEMPDEWQEKMAALLTELSDTFPDWVGGKLDSVEVVGRKNGRRAQLPGYLANYRHPQPEIRALRRKPAP
jgi:hypothetical protein